MPPDLNDIEMGLFNRKKRLPLSDIIDGLLHELNEAMAFQRLLQARQSVSSAATSQKCVEIKELDISLQVRAKDLRTTGLTSMTGTPLTYDDLEFMIDRIETEGDEFTVKILFHAK